jgi:hypothetical protein
MSTTPTESPESNWVPLTDETFDSLYEEYCTWIYMAPEERVHLVALRRYEVELAALAETNPPEHQTWRNAIDEWESLSAQLDVELGDRRREGRPAFTDDQKARVDAAHVKMAATYDAWRAIGPRVPTIIWAPEIQSRLEHNKTRIAALQGVEVEWRKYEKFTPEENGMWWHLCGGLAQSPKFFDETESAIAYLIAKLNRLHLAYQDAKRDSLGLKPRLGFNLGLKMHGKKFKKVRR